MSESTKIGKIKYLFIFLIILLKNIFLNIINNKTYKFCYKLILIFFYIIFMNIFIFFIYVLWQKITFLIIVGRYNK